MLRDYRQLIWLKIRHARSSLTRLMYAVGTDIVKDNSAMERIYQLYAFIGVAVSLALSWLGLLNVVSTACQELGATAISQLVSALFLISGLLLLALCLKYIRSSPLKLNYADITYIAAGTTKVTALVYIELLQGLLLQVPLASLLGFLLGVVIQSGLNLPFDPLRLVLFCVMLAVFSDLVSWLLGLLRLRLSARARRIYFCVAILIVAFIAVVYLLFMFKTSQSGILALLALIPSSLVNLIVFFMAGIVCGLLALTLLSLKVNMTAVIEDNALYAELYPLRHLQMYDSNSYNELRRRKTLAFRQPRGSLPLSSGKGVLLLRACLSHFRQYEGIPKLFILGISIAPTGAFLFLGSSFEPVMLLLWVFALIFFPLGQRELTRVFRDDQRNRMIRDLLPYETLGLLILDTLPAFLFVSVLSLLTVFFLFPFGGMLVAASLMTVLLNGALVICSGLDSVKISRDGRRFSYEFSLLTWVLIVWLTSYSSLSLLVIPAAIALEALYIRFLVQSYE